MTRVCIETCVVIKLNTSEISRAFFPIVFPKNRASKDFAMDESIFVGDCPFLFVKFKKQARGVSQTQVAMSLSGSEDSLSGRILAIELL